MNKFFQRCLCLLFLLTAATGHAQAHRSSPAAQILHQARVESSSNHWESASVLYRQASETDPSDTGAFLGLGQSLHHLKRFAEASEAYQKALDLNPDLTNAWVRFASCSFSSGQYQKAVEGYQKYLSLVGDAASGEPFYWLGRSLAQQGRFTEAENACRRAIGRNPTNADYLFELGFCLQRLHRNTDATDAFKHALTVNPNNSFGWLTIGGCYYQNGNFSLAAIAFQKAVELNPTNDDAFDWLGRALSESKKFADAEQASRRAIQLNPTNVFYYVQLGFCQDAQGHYGEAIQTLQQAVKMNPQYAVGFQRFGITEYHAKDFTLAVDLLQKSLELEPTNTVSLYWLGSSLQQLDRHADAVQAFEKELKIEPDNFGANLGCGMSLMFLGDFDSATARFESAQAANGNETSIRPILFSCYLLSAQYGNAYHLFPRLFTIAGGLLALSYSVGLTFLLRYSFRVRPKQHPGIGFTFAWLGIFFEGQVALIAFLGLLSLVSVRLNPLAGILLAALPVIYAAVRAFPRQPWGAPFAWPPKFGPWQVVVMAFLGLLLSMILNMGLETLYIRVTHSLMPDQDTIPLFKYAMARNPVIGILAIVVLVPMAEEIIFRGLMQSALEERVRTSLAVIITAAVFAIVHLQSLYLVPLFCFGLLLGAIRVRTGSLGLPMLIHMANNGLSLLMLKLAEHG